MTLGGHFQAIASVDRDLFANDCTSLTILQGTVLENVYYRTNLLHFFFNLAKFFFITFHANV